MAASEPQHASETESLRYNCPSCEADVAIEQHLIGETVECPDCGRPFLAEPPRAYPTLAEDIPADEDPSVTPATVSDVEATEKVIRPVIFRRHFFSTIFNVIGMGLGVTALILAAAGMAAWGFEGLWLIVPGAVLLAVCGFYLLKWFLLSRMQSLTLTNERLIYRYGIVQRDTSEMRFEDVRNFKIEQDLMERLLNFGDIFVSSAGQDDMEVVIHDVPNPKQVADFIRTRQ